MNTKHPPYSYHIFMFPFKWDYIPMSKSYDELTFKERTSLKDFDDLIKSCGWTEASPWLDSSSKGNSAQKYYNEEAFYYPFVRKAIHRSDKDLAKCIVVDYEKKLKDAVYEISIKKQGEIINYNLGIDKILLNVYNSGVAIISFHLMNYKYKDPDDILRINDFGRRVYPQFLDTSAISQTNNIPNLVGVTKEAFLADKICIKEKSGNIIVEEDFSYFNEIKKRIIEDPYTPHIYPTFISKVLGDSYFLKEKQNDKNHIKILSLLDDRMFVVCWYMNDNEVKKLGYKENEEVAEEWKKYGYLKTDEQVDFWMKYMFVDNSGNSCQNKIMRRDLLEKHTYSRWADWGTFYGISRYSLVMLSGRNDFAINILGMHIQTIYFQMIRLVLAQRTSLLRFSGEIALIVKNDTYDLSQKTASLYEEYLQFISKVYFREVSSQEQGIELYKKMQEVMEIERNVKDLDREIEELHSFASLMEEQKNNELLDIVALLAGYFLIPTLIAGYYGMNFFDENDFGDTGQKIIRFIFLFFLISTPLIYLKYKQRKGKNLQNIKWYNKPIVNLIKIKENIPITILLLLYFFILILLLIIPNF